MSGIERGGTLRFLTLTSSNESPDTCQHSWHVLIQRLRRRHLVLGYIKVPESCKNGKQHLHVLFRGSYIEQALISAWWNEIHHAKVVDIRKTRYARGGKRLASYMAKYMSKENIYRYSWDWGWVWRGFVKDWQKLKRYFSWLESVGRPHKFEAILRAWRQWLHGTWRPPFYIFDLYDFKIGNTPLLA